MKKLPDSEKRRIMIDDVYQQIKEILKDSPPTLGGDLDFNIKPRVRITDMDFTPYASTPWGKETYVWSKPFSPYVKKNVLMHDVDRGDPVSESDIKKSDAERFDDSMKGI